MFPALPAGMQWTSGASPRLSTISNAPVFCPSMRSGFDELTRVKPLSFAAAPAKAAAPAAATNGGAFVTVAEEDLAKCNNCKTCYQDLPELFEKTKIMVNGAPLEIGHLIPGAIDRVKLTPELKAKVARVAANCDAEIIHEH